MVDLKDKISLVTGAGRGIGREIALTLARNGADVVLTDISDDIFEVAKQIESLNVKALPLKCDVSDYSQVAAVEKQVSEIFKKLDVLVNNAGIYPYKAFADMTPEEWRQVLRVNLDGAFYFARVFIPGMLKQHYGKIINIASIAGAVVGFSNLVHYSASKAGMVGFTRSLALELAPYNVNVNAIAPGAIDVGATLRTEVVQQVIKAIPMGKMGLPADIANLVAFLASDQANYITGQCIICDGGYTLP